MPSFFKNRSSSLLPERDPLRVERILEVLHVIMENFFLQFSLETSIFGRKDTADFVRRLLSCRDLNLRKRKNYDEGRGMDEALDADGV